MWDFPQILLVFFLDNFDFVLSFKMLHLKTFLEILNTTPLQFQKYRCCI